MVFLGESKDHPQGNRLTRKEKGMTDLTARPIRAGPHLRARISDFIFSKGKGYIMRTLKLTFSTSGKSNFTLSIDNAKDDLTLETVRQEAAKLIPVLVTRSGAEVKEFIKATVTTITDEVLE